MEIVSPKWDGNQNGMESKWDGVGERAAEPNAKKLTKKLTRTLRPATCVVGG
jgi:hypothetical protein